MYGWKNPRGIAIEVIYEIIYKNHSRDKLLEHYLYNKDISESDKRLIHNIIISTLRYKEIFDDIVASHLKINNEKIEKKIMVAVEMALAQILAMDRIPAYAAVSETINGYKSISKNIKGANFLNFALRKITNARDLRENFERYQKKNLILERLIKELKDEIPEDDLIKIYRTSLIKPLINIRIRTNRDKILEILKNNNINYELSEMVPSAVLITENISIDKLKKLLPANSFIIQSELSQLAVHLLNMNRGDSLLDVCSGNQIKSLQIFELLGGDVDITSIDIKENKNPLFKYIKADASKFNLNNSFDKILIDAPCSGLGTLSQNPEIKFRINRSTIKRFSYIQYQILTNISKYLKKGGRLLYSVCTITNSETTNLIKKFVEENPQFEIIRPDMGNSLLYKFICKEGFIRISDYNHNSFFYALLERK